LRNKKSTLWSVDGDRLPTTLALLKEYGAFVANFQISAGNFILTLDALIGNIPKFSIFTFRTEMDFMFIPLNHDPCLL